MSLSLQQRRLGRWLAVLIVVVPTVVLSTGAMAVFGGGVGQVVPMMAVGALVLTGVTMKVSQSAQTRTAVREVFCGLVAFLSGAGAWLGMVAVGIGLNVIPFIGGGNYPHAGAWMVLTFAVGIAMVPLAWWLLRRAIIGDGPLSEPTAR